MANLTHSLTSSSADDVKSASDISLNSPHWLWGVIRFFLGAVATVCALLPLYGYYARPWLAWQWQPLDQWLATRSCLIHAWCIPQFSQQPLLLAALAALLFFALALHRRRPLFPALSTSPILTYPPHPWRAWLAVGLFSVFAGALIALQAYQLIVDEVRAVHPTLWLFGIFAALAAALLWDAEDVATLQRTLANGVVALALTATIVATAALIATHTPIAWGILLFSLLLLVAGSYWSKRCNTFLQPLDHIAMLVLSIMALLLSIRFIWSWRYAFIGDEWGFLEIATVLIHRPELYQTFTTHDSNGYHTVFSSYLQAWTMMATEENLFGWRLSSLLPMVFSVPALYVFAYWWAGRAVAWLSAGAFAASHMLLSFSMVPYNNTQALLPLTLGLGCFAFAIRSNSRLRFLFIGMVVGLGFLVYGLSRLAAIPIGLLLLIHIWPQREQVDALDVDAAIDTDPIVTNTIADTIDVTDSESDTGGTTSVDQHADERPTPQPWHRFALSRMIGAGVAVIAGAIAVAAPMLFNLQNWQDMMMATPAESEVIGQIDPTVQMWRNVLLGAHSFLTNQKYTHFVVGPYVDPLTGLLVLIGMGALLGNLWRNIRWASIFASGWILIVITSALQQYDHVSNTRMFLLVVCYALFAGFGGALLLQFALRRERYVLVMIVPLLMGLVWINQWHIIHVAQARSQQLPIAIILQQLQESAAADGGGMPLFVVTDDNRQRMNLIVRAHAIPRERTHYLQGDDLLDSPQICGAVDEPTMALIDAREPQLAQIEQYFANCWPDSQLTPLKNQVNEVLFYRFLTQSGAAELAKPSTQRASARIFPDTFRVENPSALAVSEDGRLFALSSTPERVWQMDTSGTILNSFPLTQTQPIAVALAPTGELIVASQESNAPLAWYSTEGDLLYQLGPEEIRIHPMSLAVATNGAIYVSDGGNGRILAIAPRPTTSETNVEEDVILTVLTANGQLRNPSALALASDGSLWVIDTARRELLQLSPDDELLTSLPLPTIREVERADLTVTEQGDLLVSSPGDGRVLRLDQNGQILERWFGFNNPTRLALAGDGRLYVSDPTVDQIGILPPLRDTLPAVPLPVIADVGDQPVSPLSPLAAPATTLRDDEQGAAFRIVGADELGSPLGVAVGPNNKLYVADAGRAQLAIFTADGTLQQRVTEGGGSLVQPSDVVVDQEGLVYLLDAGRGQILLFDAEGNFQREFIDYPDLLSDARGLGIAPNGSVWVAGTRRGRVSQIGADGNVVLEYPSTPADDGQPVDVTVDGEGRIYLVEASTSQLVQLSRLGIRRNSWSLPGFNTGHAPHLAVDTANALYITAPEQGAVTKFDEQGRVLASWQLPRSSDIAVKPIGIDVDSKGNIWVANAEEGVVVKIEPR